MLIFIVRRLALACVVAVSSLTLLAALALLVPGDPVKLILGPRATPELSALARLEMGLDQPPVVQVTRFLGNALRGDLGTDFFKRVPVTFLIGEALPHTLILAAVGLLLAAGVGIPLGVLSARNRGSWIDTLIAAGSVSLVTLPSYVIGLLLLLVFAVWLDLAPAIGAGTFDDPLDYLAHLVLPAVALAAGWAGYLARLVRASMVESLQSEFVRATLAFGVPRNRAEGWLTLRNALIPTVAVLGVGLGNLLGGAVFVEAIFTRPGLGQLILDSIETRNYPVMRGAVLVATLLFVLANVAADICQRVLDPRLRQ